MHRALERFSAFASTGVILVYLGGLFAGTATYFVGHLIGVSPDLAASIGIALALAVEVHSFLSQRLTRQVWQQLRKLDASLPEWDAAVLAFRVHLGITCGLVAFSVFNSVAFWALELHPQNAADWLSVGLRGLIIPCAFLAAGFLTALEHDASQLLKDAEHVMLRRTVRIMTRQWHKRIARAHKAGVDLAPVAAALMEDAHETAAARRIRIITSALDAAERGPAAEPMLLGATERPDRPPTGPGTPLRTGTGRDRASGPAEAAEGMLRLGATVSRAQDVRATRHARKRSAQLRQVRGWLNEDPRMSRGEIARRLKCSPSHAGRLKAEALDALTLKLAQ